MTTKVVMAGATGWVGRALVPAIGAQADLELVGAVARRAAGHDAGVAANGQPIGLAISASLADALADFWPRVGFGDTLQTFFFSPKTEGFVLGFGPAISYPTGTDGFSAHQWAAGPAGLVLKQQGHMTYGLLATQLWAVDTGQPQEVNTTLLQPFFNYTFPNTTGVVVNFESTYDWTREQWTVPLNVGVTHMYKFGANQKVQAGVFGRYYLDSPDGGPDWGLRFVLTYLIPS